MAVVADLQESVEDMLVGGGSQVRLVIARPQAPCDREAARGGRADEYLAAADLRQPRFALSNRVANARHRRC